MCGVGSVGVCGWECVRVWLGVWECITGSAGVCG